MKEDDSVLIDKIHKGLEAMENGDVYSEEEVYKILDLMIYSSEINKEDLLEEDIKEGKIYTKIEDV